MKTEENIVRVKLHCKSGAEYSDDVQISISTLVISDMTFAPLITKCKNDEIEACYIYLQVNDLNVTIENYTITDNIYFSDFSDSFPSIKWFITRGTNVHIVNHTIHHMQADCQEVIICDCKINELEIGLFEHHKLLKESSKANDPSGLTAFCMNNIDFRESYIATARFYVQCQSISFRGSTIDNLFCIGGFGGKQVAQIGTVQIWEYSKIGNLELHCIVDRLKVEKSSITNLVARAHCMIQSLLVLDSTIYDAYSFEKIHFKTMCYDSWLLISRSAGHSKKFSVKAEANYQMAKLNTQNETGISRFIGKLFCYCTGFGYKPSKIFLASLVVVILSSIFYCIEDVFTRSANHSLISNILLAIASFVGQSGLKISDGIPFVISMAEYIFGITFFAMFVNALYVRYKE